MNTKELIGWLYECGERAVNPRFCEAARTIEQLQARCEELQDELANADRDIETVKQQRDSYRHERTALAIQNERLERERDELVAFAESVKTIPTAALRQYCHNDGSDYVFGYDKGYCDGVITKAPALHLQELINNASSEGAREVFLAFLGQPTKLHGKG